MSAFRTAIWVLALPVSTAAEAWCGGNGSCDTGSDSINFLSLNRGMKGAEPAMLKQKRADLKEEKVNSMKANYGDDDYAKMYFEAMMKKPGHPSGALNATFEGASVLDSDGDGLITQEEFENKFDAFLDYVVETEMGRTGANREQVEDALIDEPEVVAFRDWEMSLEQTHGALKPPPPGYHDEQNGKARNWRQKSWAAKNIVKMSEVTCGRHNFPIRSYAKAPWEGCRSGYNNLGVWCQGCLGEEEALGACWERCGDQRRLPQLSVGCNLGVVAYCTETSGDCAEKVVDVVTSWAAVAASLNPGTKALAKAARAAKAAKKSGGSTAAAKAFLKVAMRATFKKLKKKAKKNLKRFMGNYGKQLKDSVVEDILEGGLESLSAYALKGNSDVGELAQEIIAAVDPTGIYDAVRSLDGGKRCRDLMLDQFPQEGLNPY